MKHFGSDCTNPFSLSLFTFGFRNAMFLTYFVVGMGFINRKAARLITSYEDISQEGDEWVIHIHTAVISGTHRYKVGVEVEESMMDGRKIRVNRKCKSPGAYLMIFGDY